MSHLERLGGRCIFGSLRLDDAVRPDSLDGVAPESPELTRLLKITLPSPEPARRDENTPMNATENDPAPSGVLLVRYVWRADQREWLGIGAGQTVVSA